MDWKTLSPYILPLLIAALLFRRVMRAQKPQTIRIERLWIFPLLLTVVTAMSLAREPAPNFLVLIAFMAAALIGAAIGWFRVHTLEFSLDAESGKVAARATQFGALLILALIVLRMGADMAFKQFGLSTG